jgi:hypothetical protein
MRLNVTRRGVAACCTFLLHGSVAAGRYRLRFSCPTSDDHAGNAMTWSDIVLATSNENAVRFVAYVPDNILTPLTGGVTTDPDFVCVAPREKTRPSARRPARIWRVCAPWR